MLRNQLRAARKSFNVEGLWLHEITLVLMMILSLTQILNVLNVMNMMSVSASANASECVCEYGCESAPRLQRV